MKRMMKSTAAALMLSGLTLSASGGELRSGVVSDEATWVAHINVEALVDSTLGQLILSEDSPADLSELDHLRDELGVDPLEIVFSVTAFGIGEDDQKFTAVLETSDEIDRVWDRIADEEGVDYRRIRENGLTVHVLAGEDDADHAEKMYVAESSAGRRGRRLLVASPSLELAIAGSDRLERGGGPALVGRRGPRNGSIAFVAASEIPGMSAHNGPASALFKAAEGIKIDLGENDGEIFIRAALETGDAEKANQAVVAVQGLMSMAQLMGGSAQEPEVRQALQLLGGLRVGVDGDTLTAAFDIHADDLMGLIQEHHAEHRGQDDFDDDWGDEDVDEESDRIRDLEAKIDRLERLLEEDDG